MDQQQTKRQQMAEMEAGAKAFAAAEKSDPFAFSRAMSHIKVGVASYRIPTSGGNGFYEAEAYQEQRTLPDGRAYQATAYRNAKRP